MTKLSIKLQEAFNATIEHLFLTWREMRASNTFANDLEKVMDVTKDQILMALSKEPTSMDKFTEDLPKFGKVFFLDSGFKVQWAVQLNLFQKHSCIN